MLDHQLEMLPEEAALHFERGELWLNAGSVDMARDAYQTASILAPSGDVHRAAQRRLAKLGLGGDTLH